MHKMMETELRIEKVVKNSVRCHNPERSTLASPQILYG